MEGIIQNPGLQHIVSNCLMPLDKKSISAIRFVNQDFRRITDCPRFFIRKLGQETSENDVIDTWKALIQKIPEDEEEIKRKLTLQLFKMCGEGGANHPLNLAYKLAKNKKAADDKLAMFIIENSDPKTIIQTKNVGNLTPMHVAALTGYVQSATRMINNSALPMVAANDIGITPIGLAALKNHVGMVQLLMANVENPNAPNDVGNTPIHAAAFLGFLEVVRLLITSTINPNIANIGGVTPIHCAANGEHIEIIILLMISNNNPNVADNNGHTAIHYAASRGNIEIVRLLMNSTNNPNVASNDGLSPIHCAAFNGHIEVVRLLMTSTNNPNVPDNFGRTPENLASQYGHHDTVELLKNPFHL